MPEIFWHVFCMYKVAETLSDLTATKYL